MTKIMKIPENLIIENKIEMIKETPAILEAANLLHQGEVVSFPTETVYGLGADAANAKAVKKIFKAKGRPQDNPLIVHITGEAQLKKIISSSLNQKVQKLVNAFWPGPLTIIFEKSGLIPDRTTAGLNTVAVRMPSHPVARALIEKTGLPLAAPSANISGAPSPTTAEHVFKDLKGLIPLIIDGGPSPVGVESTVIDVRGKEPQLLRPGGVPLEAIESIIGEKIDRTVKKTNKEKPISPGMKYRHYSPETPLFLIDMDNKNFEAILKDEYKKYHKIALVLTSEKVDKMKRILEKSANWTAEQINIVNIGSQFQVDVIASRLFKLLRQLDEEDYSLILVETIPEKGLGAAVMNRLHKASIQ
ncbi:MAG: L-threonylcarbamoyladenylate synthase [Halothermotrichaceae bacterium]